MANFKAESYPNLLLQLTNYLVVNEINYIEARLLAQTCLQEFLDAKERKKQTFTFHSEAQEKDITFTLVRKPCVDSSRSPNPADKKGKK